MSRMVGWLYAAGVFVLVLGGVAVVLSLTAGRAQPRLPLWTCAAGAALLVPEGVRQARAMRRRRTEALRLRRQARKQHTAALAAAELARRSAAQSRFDRFVAAAEMMLAPLAEIPDRHLPLQSDEQCFAFAETAAHVTTRKPMPAARGDRPMVRIDAGMRYQIEAGPRNPLADLTERIADRGALCITNRRIVFDGGRERLNIPLEKILQVHLDGNRIILLVQQQFHPVIFSVRDRYQAPVMAAAIYRLSQIAQAGEARIAVDGGEELDIGG